MTPDMDLLDKKLASLTEQIFAEIGAPTELAGDERLRAAAISRIENLLCGFIAHEMHEALSAQDEDCSVDIIFGRQDAEYVFDDLTPQVPVTK